ncbi:MAG: hypothetical protein ACFCU6_10150, partial [Balneolaceae bacterium]
MKQLFILFNLLLLFYPHILYSQGFNVFSGRNHPYLNWKVAETEHFQIIYPERISGIEAQAAAIAEESYVILSKNLDVTFNQKIRIYLSDEDEINNGFAVPIGNGHTNIWVNLNDYIEIWTGREKWLRKVIAHELAHIFHFRAIRTNMGLWQFVTGDPLPSFFTEGLAQYQTEVWDSQRGDRWLRMAVFDDRLDYDDGQSIYNGRLMYAIGNSQLRFFAEQYGDSTLADILKQRKSFLGFWEQHDFFHAFEEATGVSYSNFRDNWRKQINIYYNTLASQMERVDSLSAEPLSLPGTFFFDVKQRPGKNQVAVLSLPSMNRPVRRLYLNNRNENDNRKSRILAEGSINPDLSWSADGRFIAYSRTVRGKNSSIVNDIFIYDLEEMAEKQITFSRRASSPLFHENSQTISYIVNENGTANIYRRDLESGEEYRITNYTGDIQMKWLIWNNSRKEWLVFRFDSKGNRHLVLINESAGSETILDDGDIDNRMPVFNPSGDQIAFTSLRDEVPNVFIYDLKTDSIRRVTNVITGAEVYDWVPANDSLPEWLLVKASETKRGESVFEVDPDRIPYFTVPDIPQAYTTWRKKSPQQQISSSIAPDESLISSRYSYRSFKNLTHGVSILLPFYAGSDNWGLFGSTAWLEPLGKHTITASGILSFGKFDNSYGIASYMNNQFFPTLTYSIYRSPATARYYGGKFLVESHGGGDISLSWPIDHFSAPFRSDRFSAMLRYVRVDPFAPGRFADTFAIPAPQKASRADISLGWRTKKMRPWHNNMTHPLDGYGFQFLFTGSEKIFGADVAAATLDASAFKVLPALGLHRLYIYGRFQSQFGNALPQDFIGFSRFDNIEIALPSEFPLITFNEAERVRGYREFVAG